MGIEPMLTCIIRSGSGQTAEKHSAERHSAENQSAEWVIWQNRSKGRIIVGQKKLFGRKFSRQKTIQPNVLNGRNFYSAELIIWQKLSAEQVVWQNLLYDRKTFGRILFGIKTIWEKMLLAENGKFDTRVLLRIARDLEMIKKNRFTLFTKCFFVMIFNHGFPRV